ncbi:MAG: energy transducer TonB [Salegentibacter sp.]
MKKIFTLLFLCQIGIVFAQDTIYMDKNYKDLESSSNAQFYKITEKVEGKKYDFIRRTYWMNGQIKAEQSYYLEGDRHVYQGQHRHWYESGKAFYMADYRKGTLDGNLVAFWENGQKKRQDRFRNGEFVSGKVWNDKGEEIGYFPHFIRPTFPGGQEAMADYLRAHSKVRHQEGKPMVRVVVKFVVDKEGYPSDMEIVEGGSEAYNREALRLVKTMPKWNPGSSFGEPVRVIYALPIMF